MHAKSFSFPSSSAAFAPEGVHTGASHTVGQHPSIIGSLDADNDPERRLGGASRKQATSRVSATVTSWPPSSDRVMTTAYQQVAATAGPSRTPCQVQNQPQPSKQLQIPRDARRKITTHFRAGQDPQCGSSGHNSWRRQEQQRREMAKKAQGELLKLQRRLSPCRAELRVAGECDNEELGKAGDLFGRELKGIEKPRRTGEDVVPLAKGWTIGPGAQISRLPKVEPRARQPPQPDSRIVRRDCAGQERRAVKEKDRQAWKQQSAPRILSYDDGNEGILGYVSDSAAEMGVGVGREEKEKVVTAKSLSPPTVIKRLF